MTKKVFLYATSTYPCQWDDLIDDKHITQATIYTLKEAKEDVLKEGISKAKDGIYDIVIDVPFLTKAIVQNALERLSKKAKTEHVLLS